MDQGLVPGRVGETQTRLEIVLVGRARGNKAIAHQASSVRSGNLSALERSGFIVPAQAGVHRQFARELPCVLPVKAINVVFGRDLSRAKCHGKVHSRIVGLVRKILSKVKLRKQRIPRIVADVETKLGRMASVRPRHVVNVLIPFLQTALGTAEVGACLRAIRMDHARCGAVVRSRGYEAIEDKTRLIDQSRPQCGDEANI